MEVKQKCFSLFNESSALFYILVLFLACSSDTAALQSLGRFSVEDDLFVAQFDSKTDVDDLYSVAAVATILADPRFSEVRHHAVAGAYGIQDRLYVPANELFELAFGSNWSEPTPITIMPWVR